MVPDRIIGAFVFPDVWNDLVRFTSLVRTFRDYGINTVLTESPTYDEDAIDLVHALGLSFCAGVACFSDHASRFAEISARPELWPILETGERRPQMEWYVGITPTDRMHQEGVLQRIESIATDYPVDALFLDFVRWPLHWEIELRPGRARALDSSFDPVTLAQFLADTGIELPPDLDTMAERAAWIRAHHAGAWTDFKCRVVTDFVAEARERLKAVRPDAGLGIYVVPEVEGLTEPLTGQRLRDLAPLAEWVSPMLYHNILLRPPGWVGPAISEAVAVAGRKTLPVVQADSNRDPAVAADLGPDMSIDNWRAALAEALPRSDTAGLIVFQGMNLIGNGRGEALRAMLDGRG